MNKLLLILLVGFISCSTENSKQELPYEELNVKIYGSSIREITYQGCEYLVSFDRITHKGNCSNPIHTCK